MEALASSTGTTKHTLNRNKSSLVKDLCLVTKQGSLSEFDSALAALKKGGVNIDARNGFGLAPLHIATWRNHLPIVRRLLAAGADPDARDGESGWSSLHRALHFGHLAVAGALMEAGASLNLEDAKGRTPVDLLSGPVSQIVGKAPDSVETEVFSWGSGTNYQLGTGNAHIQKLPCKVDVLHDSYIKHVAASKFHSVAIGGKGELYTWGFGRGGRLGHPDFDIHSGQAAVITPRQVMLGLGSRCVKVVAAAKHHTVIATEVGEVFTWGSNREGQLGYTSVDTQPTPRRVSSLRVRITAVAAANKHSAAVAETGEVFTWGCNKEGQLGYGTSNSASNYYPRLVECLKGKAFKSVSAAKYHTVVVEVDGEVFTWGHRLVTPKRVVIARSLKKCGNTLLKFHRVERLHVLSVAAGLIHTTALTDDGALFYWVSSDPDLRCQQLYSMCGRNVVSISAGKHWTAAVTTTGDVFMWDGKKNEEVPSVSRLHGIKQATSICVGETHLLALCSLYHPTYPPNAQKFDLKNREAQSDELEELEDDILFSDVQTQENMSAVQGNLTTKRAPTLKSLCEKVAIEFMLEPKSSIQLMEIADSLEAPELRKHCEEMAIRNLDYIFTTAASSIINASPEILVKLEKVLDEKSAEPWSHRRLPTMTATFPAIIDSDEGEDFTNQKGLVRVRNNKSNLLNINRESRTDSFMLAGIDADQAVSKQVRALRKKLQQIEMLEQKQLCGQQLDNQQLAKVASRAALVSELEELGFPYESEESQLFTSTVDVKGSNKSEGSKKQRRKNKQKTAPQLDISSVVSQEHNLLKRAEDSPALLMSEEKLEKELDNKSEISEEISLESIPGDSVTSKSDNKAIGSASSKNKKNRKGGLSLFLSGALDEAPKPTPQVTTPKHEGPAWGGAKFAKGPASLRDIQNEQSKKKTIVTNVKKPKECVEEMVEPACVVRVPLASFLSNPVAVVPARGAPTSEGETSTPPWSSVGSSPQLSRPSLRDIQMQQEKKHQGIIHSPKTRTSGFSIPSHTMPSEISSTKDSAQNRWYRPDTDTPSSLRSIQIEERAMKDLKRFYSSVKLVKPQTN
ncbi:hypothetical protein LUZ61_010976 [Rhynchospora tenuis]|uniref:RCC1-like domain-containing protein n=1 Tax=Rhynchospora tenuis TaxID=198213 RepID=A0AAD6A041_9POAL|nr:hypothetical protein LUZ61_010976 [Rhynchospora tenuis]